MIRLFSDNFYHWLAIFRSLQTVSFEQISIEWISETSLFMSLLDEKDSLLLLKFLPPPTIILL